VSQVRQIRVLLGAKREIQRKKATAVEAQTLHSSLILFRSPEQAKTTLKPTRATQKTKVNSLYRFTMTFSSFQACFSGGIMFK